MSNIFKKIKISWTYPTQPTSLQIGTVKIYRGTSEFTLDNVLSQVELVSQEYDPTFTSFTDDFELEYDVTYYYMIIVYGDIDSTISAATDLYSIKIEGSPSAPILPPSGSSSRYAIIPWEFPVGILPKPNLEDIWDSTLNGGYGESTDGYSEIYYRLREPENVNEWTVEINDQVIGVTQTYNKSLPDDFEEVTLWSLLQKSTGLEYVYLNYENVVGEEATRKELFLDPDFSAPWLEGVIYEVLAEEIAEGRGIYDNGYVVTESLNAAILVNHTGEPIKLKLTPTRPETTLLPQWDWGFYINYDEADGKYSYAFVNSLPALAERIHMEKGALPTVDPITGAITIIIDPELTEEI